MADNEPHDIIFWIAGLLLAQPTKKLNTENDRRLAKDLIIYWWLIG